MSVLVLIACAISACVLAAVAALLVATRPRIDPTSPQATNALVRRGLRSRGWLRAVAASPQEPTAATSVALTLALTVVVSGAAGLGVLLWMVRAHWGVADLDEATARWAARNATDVSADVLRVVTDLGATTTVVALAIVVVLVEMRRAPSFGVAAFVVLVVGGQSTITNLVKEVVDRARPEIDPIGAYSGPSFPSGHSATAAAAYAAFALVLGRRRGHATQTWLFAVAGAVTGAVAATRVLLGVHWVTDVLAGIALGWTWFAACAIAFGGRLVRYGAPVELAERTRTLHDP